MKTYRAQFLLAAALLAVAAPRPARADFLHAYAEANAVTEGVGGFGEFAKQADITWTKGGLGGTVTGHASASSSGGSNARNISLAGYSQAETVGFSLRSGISFTHSIWR